MLVTSVPSSILNRLAPQTPPASVGPCYSLASTTCAAALPRVWWPHEDPLLPHPTRLSSPRSWCTSNSLTHLPRSHPLAVHRRETSSSTRPRPSIPPRPSQPRTSCSTSRCLTSPTTEGLPPAVYPHKLSYRPPRPARLNILTSRASPTRGGAATACSPTRLTPLPSPSHSPTHHPSRVHTAVESPIRVTDEGFFIPPGGGIE